MMKKLTISCLALLSSLILSAQTNESVLFLQSKFPNFQVRKEPRALSNEQIYIEADLKTRSIQINGQYFDFVREGARWFLVDEQKGIHAIFYGNTLIADGKTYKIRQRGRFLVNENKERVGNRYKVIRKRRCFYAIKIEKEVPGEVIALFFYKELERIHFENQSISIDALGTLMTCIL